MRLGFLSAAAFIMVAIAYGQARRRNPPVPHLLALWLLVAAAPVAITFWTERTAPFTIATTSLAVYLFLGEIYVFVYAAAVGSLSLRLMAAMFRLRSAPDVLQRTLQEYPAERFLDIRLKNLVAQGFLVETDGRYRASEKGHTWARFGVLLKRLLAVDGGG